MRRNRIEPSDSLAGEAHKKTLGLKPTGANFSRRTISAVHQNSFAPAVENSGKSEKAKTPRAEGRIDFKRRFLAGINGLFTKRPAHGRVPENQ